MPGTNRCHRVSTTGNEWPLFISNARFYQATRLTWPDGRQAEVLQGKIDRELQKDRIRVIRSPSRLERPKKPSPLARCCGSRRRRWDYLWRRHHLAAQD